MSDDRKQLHVIWRALFRMDPPPEQSWQMWEIHNTPTELREAILQLALKHKNTNGQMTADHMVRFVSSVLGRLNKQKREALSRLKTPAHHTPVPVVDSESLDNWGNR